MNLLLLLSAMLTALSGVAGQVRPVAPQALAAQIAGEIVPVSAAPVRHFRPTQPLPSRTVITAAPLARMFSLTAAEPIFAARRRE